MKRAFSCQENDVFVCAYSSPPRLAAVPWPIPYRHFIYCRVVVSHYGILHCDPRALITKVVLKQSASRTLLTTLYLAFSIASIALLPVLDRKGQEGGTALRQSPPNTPSHQRLPRLASKPLLLARVRLIQNCHRQRGCPVAALRLILLPCERGTRCGLGLFGFTVFPCSTRFQHGFGLK